ncbi:unnamed protein product [Lepidochelys kempii]
MRIADWHKFTLFCTLVSIIVVHNAQCSIVPKLSPSSVGATSASSCNLGPNFASLLHSSNITTPVELQGLKDLTMPHKRCVCVESRFRAFLQDSGGDHELLSAL